MTGFRSKIKYSQSLKQSCHENMARQILVRNSEKQIAAKYKEKEMQIENVIRNLTNAK